MARRLARTLDLRTDEQRKGISAAQRNIGAITDILQTLGKAEQVRRERDQLERVSRAISAGATTPEAILAVTRQPTETSGGFQGILQKLGGAFQPSPGGVQSSILKSILGSQLQTALGPKFSEPTGDFAPGTVTQRAPTGKVSVLQQTGTGPTKQQRQRDSDISTLRNKKKSEFQKEEARARLDKDPSQPKNSVRPDFDFVPFLDDKDKVKGKFSKKAHDNALKRAQDAGRTQGFDPKSMEESFENWWDSRVKDETSGFLGGALERNVTLPRSEFQEIENILDESGAKEILSEAGGDKDKARQIAKRRGFKF